MRRVLPVILPLLLPLVLLAGCGSGDALRSGPPTPVAQVRASFGGLTDTIEIGAVDRLALREAALVAPDGTATIASAINVAAAPRHATGQWAVGNPWQDPLTGGNALGMPGLQQAQLGAALQSQEQLLAMVSSAEIALPDPVVYRREWAKYRIRLTFGTPPGEIETREIAAPAPPPR